MGHTQVTTKCSLFLSPFRALSLFLCLSHSVVRFVRVRVIQWHGMLQCVWVQMRDLSARGKKESDGQKVKTMLFAEPIAPCFERQTMRAAVLQWMLNCTERSSVLYRM